MPDFGGRDGGFMKKKTNYKDHSLGRTKVVRDFLPSPEELVMKDESVKVTLNLTKGSLDYFKKLGKKSKTPYQKVIRKLLDYYVSKAA